MARFSIKLWMLVVAGLLLIIGCGGGGSESGSSPDTETRSRLMKTLGFAQIAMLQGGFQTADQAGAVNGTTGSGTTGSGTSGSTGGGMGMPMIGAFIRNFGGGEKPLKASRLTRGDVETSGSTGGSTSSGGGGGEDPYFYYDEWLGLWVDGQWTDTSWTTLLYLDQEKTQPAGSFNSTYSDWNTYPITGTSSYEITAGPFAGAHGKYNMVYESETMGHMEYDNFWPSYGSDEGRSSWNATGWTWSASQAWEDGNWSKSSGTYGNDGTGQFVWENSEGYKWSYTYRPDGSGNGVIEGPDVGLPAKVSWTAAGHYRVEYADGTVEEWDMWSGDGGVGFGTSGGGGTGEVVGGGSSTGTTGSG